MVVTNSGQTQEIHNPRAAAKEERIDLRLIDLADCTRKPACSDFVTPTGALNICTNRAQGAAALI
jgi:hypothetical protein